MNFIHDIDKVIEFITKAHEGQKRKYTFEDYVEHPMEVARIVRDTIYNKDMIAAGLRCGMRIHEPYGSMRSTASL